MKNPIISILRFLLFIPLCLIIFSIIDFVIYFLLGWIFSISPFWFFVVIFFLGSGIYGLFSYISTLMVFFVTKLSPIKWFGSLIISLLAFANGIYLIYYTWSANTHYSGWDIFTAILFTFFLISLIMYSHPQDSSHHNFFPIDNVSAHYFLKLHSFAFFIYLMIDRRLIAE